MKVITISINARKPKITNVINSPVSDQITNIANATKNSTKGYIIEMGFLQFLHRVLSRKKLIIGILSRHFIDILQQGHLDPGIKIEIALGIL